MALRKPLVVVSGLKSELPPGDTVEGAPVGSLTAGSGLSGGGSLSTNQRVDVSLASNPSGIIFVGNQLGLDGVAQRTADTALASGNSALVLASSAQASGNAALSSAATALASGNAALSSAATALASGNAALAKTLINSAVNLSGGVSGAIVYQSAPSSTAFLSPGVSGQVLATRGSNQATPYWITPGGGKILQAVTYTDQGSYWETSSTTYVSTPLSVSITPSSTSSRILVIAGMNGNQTPAGAGMLFTLYRNSTNLATGLGACFKNFAGTPEKTTSIVFLDSPSTTSSITYAVYARVTGGIGALDNGGTTSAIVALEVGP